MDQVDPGRDVAPLVSPADLHLDAVVPVQDIEVDGLQDLVGEFSEGDPVFQPAGHDFLVQHVVDLEELAVVAEEFQQVHLAQPVTVVDDAEVFRAKKLHHLRRQSFFIVLDRFFRLQDPFS